jgi:hypothetical protein
MTSSDSPVALLPSETQTVYCQAMTALADAGVDYLVGGAYAFERYTGIARHTKDFDVFVHPRDVDAALSALSAAGYRTELTFPHWLGKAVIGDEFVDVIFGAGNGVAVVDDEWFAHAVSDEVLGLPARLCPAEEMIWSKAFIMERERYDGATSRTCCMPAPSDSTGDGFSGALAPTGVCSSSISSSLASSIRPTATVSREP